MSISSFWLYWSKNFKDTYNKNRDFVPVLISILEFFWSIKSKSLTGQKMNKRVIDDFLMGNELSMKDLLATARKFSSIILLPMREIINNPLLFHWFFIGKTTDFVIKIFWRVIKNYDFDHSNVKKWNFYRWNNF